MPNHNKSDKRAAIYIRTSSEHQGEGASPQEQEADCRKLAEELELTIVEVYRDIKKYRVKGRLVEPSGTRTDRPGLRAMLEAAASREFGNILAWREDRLYRGMRAMLLVLDAFQEYDFDIAFARDNFDPKMAPLKAWLAQMELDAMRERMTMGVKRRLRDGKANTGQDRYGYRRNGEVIEIVEEEAAWVKQIFEWYTQRVPMQEIRRRLIASNAPQKGSSRPRKIQWAISSIQGMLKSAKEYAFGIKIQRRNGEEFRIPVEPILNEEVYDLFLKVRAANKTYPAHNIKRDYLVRGMMYCPCGRRWSARSTSVKKHRKKTAKRSGLYFCPQQHKELVHPDCPRTIGAKKTDDYVWSKVCEVLENPEVILVSARNHVSHLLQQAETSAEERERLQIALEEIQQQRQWVITQARTGRITGRDMAAQLNDLALQETDTKRELSAYTKTTQVENLENWETLVMRYIEKVQTALQLMNETAPRTDEERHRRFKAKREIVQMLVERVEIGKDRNLKVILSLDLLSLLRGPSESDQVPSVGTCIRTK